MTEPDLKIVTPGRAAKSATPADPRSLPRVTRDEFSRLRGGERLHDLATEKTFVVRASSPTTCEATDERFEVFDLAYRETFVKLAPVGRSARALDALIRSAA